MHPTSRSTKWISALISALLFTVIGLTPAVPVTPASAQSATFYTWPASPSGSVGVAKPVVQMKVKYTGLEVTSYSMMLNGAPVPVQYDEMSGRFQYSPKENLAPGGYAVGFQLQFKGYQPKKYAWTFTVVPGAVQAFPAWEESQLEALRAVNDIRRQLGLSEVVLNNNLNLSAAAHARYQDKQGIITHEETAGKEGFTGQTLSQRIAYFGYSNDSAAEDISQQTSTSPTEAVDSLFDAPYHRIPFLDPGLKEIGYGQQGSFHVLLFGIEGARKSGVETVVSPAGNQRGVAAGWNGHEIPDPLRLHGQAAYPVGYPIMAGFYSPDFKEVRLAGASLADSSGRDIELLLNSPAGDTHLTNQLLLLPAKPLQAGETYRVKLRAVIGKQDGSEEAVDREWTFTTESLSGDGRKVLHPPIPSDLASSTTGHTGHTVTFGLDDSTYVVDQTRLPMTVKPLLLYGFSYLAIRDLEKALGARVEWDDTRKAAVYTKNNRTVVFYVNRSSYEINGTAYPTDTPARLTDVGTDNPRTMVPVRLLSDLLGCQVDYIDATRTVKITY
ncbi:stalk domain-containing protein [Paenibacillus aurantius]|uniref:Stalk domain-containing protein n=1 Tax=Paenibacillus aurantius TaxID=2918900 RepID=A0AA96RHQ8_9BACL|nr:stalk domain-containing protein [Paenibacillus aurantius]WNQ13648.1 stalk domain-containing protein [Paenibacillus aurantius]